MWNHLFICPVLSHLLICALHWIAIPQEVRGFKAWFVLFLTGPISLTAGRNDIAFATQIVQTNMCQKMVSDLETLMLVWFYYILVAIYCPGVLPQVLFVTCQKGAPGKMTKACQNDDWHFGDPQLLNIVCLHDVWGPRGTWLIYFLKM
jgi:hypothetical protein